jgi:hypothetical protein
MIGGTRSALLAASLLVAAPAVAAPPNGGHYVWVPAGATVVIVPSTPATPVDFPVGRVIAQQEAMMHRMFANLDTLMATAMPDPEQMIRSVMQGGPPMVPGSGVVLTQVSSGDGTCSETIIYGSPDASGQPQVKVTRNGNACGTLFSSGPLGVTQTMPAPRPVAPPHERLWSVGYPARPLPVHTPPHT